MAKFRLYQEGKAIQEIEVPDGTTVGELADIEATFKAKGFTLADVKINGAAATGDQIEDIRAGLARKGVAIHIGPRLAASGDVIPEGAIMAAAGAQKGGGVRTA